MALRYLVSGGNGNSNSTTNWSDTSGGASGASVPVTGDEVIIDAASLNAPITFNATMTIRTLTVSDYTGVLTINSGIVLTLFGNGIVGFLLLNSIFTITGDGTFRFIDNNASSMFINAGGNIFDCNVSFSFSSGQTSTLTLESNITVTKTFTLITTSAPLFVVGQFNINCFGDVVVSHSNLNNNHITFITGELVICGTTPQNFSCNSVLTRNSSFFVRTVFNSTSDITVSGRFTNGLNNMAGNLWFKYISGNVISDSTNELRLRSTATPIMDTGEVVWNLLRGEILTTLLSMTLASDFYVKNILGGYPTGGNTSTRVFTIRSNVGGTSRKFVILPGGSQEDIFQWRCTNDIDSNDGQTIFSFNGTNAPDRNWRLLVAPKTYSQTFIG